MFHLLQASARAEQRAIPAKGLTGTGYAGHAFWETESFVLPVLTATIPAAAADALRWRQATLLGGPRVGDHPAAARRRLRLADDRRRGVRRVLAGGHGRVPRQRRHRRRRRPGRCAWTGDADFDRECALPLLVETARLWQCLGYLGARRALPPRRDDRPGRVHRPGQRQHLHQPAGGGEPAGGGRGGRALARRGGGPRGRREEIAGWRDSADRMAVPYDDERAMPEQYRGSTRRERWDFAASAKQDAIRCKARALLRHLPQAGGQAGRPGARAALVRRAVLRRPRRRRRSPTRRS